MPAQSSAILNKPLRFYFWRSRREVCTALLCLLMTNTLETRVPLLVGRSIDAITAGQPFAQVLHTVAWILGLTLILSTTRYLWRIFWGRFHHRVAEDLRNRLFHKYTELSPSFFRSRKVGELISLIAHDVNSFRMGIGPGMLILVDGFIYAALILPTMYSISPSWTWKTLILMPLVPFTVKMLVSRIHRAYHNRQDRFAEMSGRAQEIVSGIRVVKCFAQEGQQTTSFNLYSSAFQKSCDTVANWNSFFPPTLELPVAIGSVILLMVGAPEVMRGAITIGSFFAFYQYVQRMIWPMEAIGASVSQIQEGMASFSRIRAVLETETEVPDTGHLTIDRFESLEVRNLTFRYPGQSAAILKNISFRLARGQTLGIVGETGSGKSTLIELLSRQYQAAPKTIFINGHPIEDIRMSTLRRVMAVVPQEAFLFTRKVNENLAFSRDAWLDEDILKAAGSVRLHDEIENWQHGYDAMVGERGVNLSGGQKQRMTLARALVKDAELLVLDDSLSAVDAKTEQGILSSLSTEATTIVVSHRLASLESADVILVLKDGSIETLGSRQEVQRQSPLFSRLRDIQNEAALP